MQVKTGSEAMILYNACMHIHNTVYPECCIRKISTFYFDYSFGYKIIFSYFSVTAQKQSEHQKQIII